MSKKSVVEILKEWLEENGYDGLTDEDECGCSTDDLVPCQSFSGHCVAAYLHEDPDSEFGQTFSTEKPGKKR